MEMYPDDEFYGCEGIYEDYCSQESADIIDLDDRDKEFGDLLQNRYMIGKNYLN